MAALHASFLDDPWTPDAHTTAEDEILATVRELHRLRAAYARVLKREGPDSSFTEKLGLQVDACERFLLRHGRLA
jgi:hypothetical protein